MEMSSDRFTKRRHAKRAGMPPGPIAYVSDGGPFSTSLSPMDRTEACVAATYADMLSEPADACMSTVSDRVDGILKTLTMIATGTVRLHFRRRGWF